MLGCTLFAIPTFLPCYLSFQITPHCSLSLPITLPCFLPLFCVLHPNFPAHTTISFQEHPFQCYIHPRQSALSAYYPLPRIFHINCVSYNQAWTLPKVSHLHLDSEWPSSIAKEWGRVASICLQDMYLRNCWMDLIQP